LVLALELSRHRSPNHRRYADTPGTRVRHERGLHAAHVDADEIVAGVAHERE
jgi:hypothetical protein